MKITKKEFEEAKKGSLAKWEGGMRARHWRYWCVEKGRKVCALCGLNSIAGVRFVNWCSMCCPLQDGCEGGRCCSQYQKTMVWHKSHKIDHHKNFLKDGKILREQIAALTYEMIPEEFRVT